MRTILVILSATVVFSWTSTAAAQIRLSDIEVGAHFGFNFGEGKIRQERLGGQLIVPVLGPFEVNSLFGVLIDFPEFTGGSGNAWVGFFTVAGRPFGRGSFLSLGYGVAVQHFSVELDDTGLGLSSTETSDTALFGFELPLKRIRPFADVHLVHLLDREGHSLDVFVSLGINVVL